jgi:hypothetical protein
MIAIADKLKENTDILAIQGKPVALIAMQGRIVYERETQMFFNYVLDGTWKLGELPFVSEW